MGHNWRRCDTLYCAAHTAGIHGPPMMIMYAWLGASKDQVRATNSLVAMVQDQVGARELLGLLVEFALHGVH
jgi:hypothetical protein